MKKLLSLLVILTLVTTSCTTVDAGHKGVQVSWGGSTNMERVYDEGMDVGISWLWDDMIEYDVREHTLVNTYTFNDSKDMETTVKVALDYNLTPLEVNQLHKGITDVDVKIETSLSSACKEVVPQYTAVELNKTARVKAENTLTKILIKELPEFHVEFKRVRITDVDFPKGISDLATQTAVQIGKNELASKLEQEKIFKANAVKAEAQGVADALVITSIGNLKAAQNDAKTRDLLSSDKMLRLQELENDKLRAEGYKKHGKSEFGSNNWFGVDPGKILISK